MEIEDKQIILNRYDNKVSLNAIFSKYLAYNWQYCSMLNSPAIRTGVALSRGSWNIAQHPRRTVCWLNFWPTRTIFFWINMATMWYNMSWIMVTRWTNPGLFQGLREEFWCYLSTNLPVMLSKSVWAMLRARSEVGSSLRCVKTIPTLDPW